MRIDQTSRSLPSALTPYHSSMLCIYVLNMYSSSLLDSWLHTGKPRELLKNTGAWNPPKKPSFNWSGADPRNFIVFKNSPNYDLELWWAHKSPGDLVKLQIWCCGMSGAPDPTLLRNSPVMRCVLGTTLGLASFSCWGKGAEIRR